MRNLREPWRAVASWPKNGTATGFLEAIHYARWNNWAVALASTF